MKVEKGKAMPRNIIQSRTRRQYMNQQQKILKSLDFSRGRSAKKIYIHLTSAAVTLKASHSIRGKIFRMKVGLYSISVCSSSASWKCKGKDSGEVLQALTAQVRKFTVRIFILLG